MAYCGPKALAYDEFLTWSDLSQAAALAWQHDQGSEVRCPSCGIRHDTWVDDAGEELREPPLAVVPKRCPGCELLADARDDVKDDGRKGLVFRWISSDEATLEQLSSGVGEIPASDPGGVGG